MLRIPASLPKSIRNTSHSYVVSLAALALGVKASSEHLTSEPGALSQSLDLLFHKKLLDVDNCFGHIIKEKL